MSKIGFCLVLLLSIGCGKPTSNFATKTLFSSWQGKGCTNMGTLDLSGGSYNTNFLAVLHPVGACVCTCTWNFTSGANYTASSCTYTNGSCASDPGCSNYTTSNASWNILSDGQLHLTMFDQSSTLSLCLVFQ